MIYNGNPQTATVACLGGGAATLASGGTGTNAGSYPATVNCAASTNYTAATGLAAGSFVINPATPPQTPRGNKRDVLNELIALRGTVTNMRDGSKLDDAIRRVTNSLEPGLWIDDSHLRTKDGDEVFKQEKDAVNKLRDLIKDNKSTLDKTRLQGFINRLAGVDRELARIAISEAVQAGGSARDIEKAQEELSKGDGDHAVGKSDTAIEHYRNAWQHALKATNLIALLFRSDPDQFVAWLDPPRYQLYQRQFSNADDGGGR